ncbi:MAG: ATP-binding cassette domain-containing protein [Mariniblastus sp.]|nr:ATP-binding cassette domain-containing protein [Mariniblastus sp.]
MQILNIDNATVYRGPTKVFSDLNLAIDFGENTAIVGPNGAGKTTLLKLLAREIYPSTGNVQIFGKDRWNVWELRKRLGLVSPDLQQNYAMSAKGASVVLSGFHSSVDIYGHQTFTAEQLKVAESVLNDLKIDHLCNTPFSSMSTGEQRRHLLGRALVNDPEALVLDEPTNGLDLPSIFQYLETVRRLMQSGKTVILVTHHIHEIPPEITQVVLMKHGKIISHGSKEKNLNNESLSELFDCQIKVANFNGYYQVVPA